jgi:hypothetical protein
MPDYQIRIHGHGRGFTHLDILYLNDSAAIRAAEILAAGRPFEVWCGQQRIHGVPRLPSPPPFLGAFH